MNLLEGARRLQVVGKAINFTGIGLVLFGFLVTLVLATVGGAISHRVLIEPAAGMLIVALGFWPLLFGGLLWIGGWVLEGFVKPKVESGLSRADQHTHISRR